MQFELLILKQPSNQNSLKNNKHGNSDPFLLFPTYQCRFHIQVVWSLYFQRNVLILYEASSVIDETTSNMKCLVCYFHLCCFCLSVTNPFTDEPSVKLFCIICNHAIYLLSFEATSEFKDLYSTSSKKLLRGGGVLQLVLQFRSIYLQFKSVFLRFKSILE